MTADEFENPVLLDGATELISGGLVEELAAASRAHRVMITISVTPYDDDVEADQ